MESQITKENILDRFSIKESDTIERLNTIAEKTLRFVKYNQETKGLEFVASKGTYTNREKIALLLIGNYVKTKLISDSKDTLTLSEIRKALDIPVTTLSKPLGQLKDGGWIRKTEEANYKFNHHKVEEFLDNMISQEK